MLERNDEQKNMNMDKVYVVFRGEYSDKSVDGVFSSKEKADEYLDSKDDDYYVEEFGLDAKVPSRETQIYRIDLSIGDKHLIGTKIVGKLYNGLIRVQWAYDKTASISIFVESDSKERAVKVASERYGAIFANEQLFYPFLRMGVVKRYGHFEYPYYDFITGEIVLIGEQAFGMQMPEYIKFTKRE